MKNLKIGIMLLLVCCLCFLFAWPTSSEQQPTNSTRNNINNDTKNSIQSRCEKIQGLCQSKKGSPYVWGAEGPDSFDCSGFIYYIMKRIGNPVPRTTARKYWIYFKSKPEHWKNSTCGNIVWWTLERSRPKGHIGIMVENPRFWQAGSSGGVYSRIFFKGSFWSKHFVGSKNPF